MEPLTEDQIKSLELERYNNNETQKESAQRILADGLVPAAYTIVGLATNANNERLRFAAAQYVVDRNLGRIQDNPPAAPDDPFKDLLAKCVSDVTGLPEIDN